MQPPTGPPSSGSPRFVRQFALTQGRATSSGRALPLEALVTAMPVAPNVALSTEQRSIVAMCSSPRSIAEISSYLQVHLGIARVLVGDMVALGLATVSVTDNDTGPDLLTLERLLHDLERL